MSDEPKPIRHQMPSGLRAGDQVIIERQAINFATQDGGNTWDATVSQMPETPDFEQLARAALTDQIGQYDAYRVGPVADALRQVWNARGAADLAVLLAEDREEDDLVTNALIRLESAIRKLDR
jgi:hypothetical protein